MKNNQLLTAFDASRDAAGINDFEGHGLDNYGYNQIGELIKGSKEQIEEIIWTADHKISYIKRGQVDPGQDTEASSDLEFFYDAMGNRISKHVIPRDEDLYLESEENQSKEFYVRDATGNTMAVYKKSYNTQVLRGIPPASHDQVAVLALQENSIYGSQRVGVHRDYRSKAFSFGTTVVTDPNTGAAFYAGEDYTGGVIEYQVEDIVTRTNKKSYEFTNHLGNVLSTSSDRKSVLESNEGRAEYISQVLSQQDYYPFGMVMPGRSYAADVYRYGFQGQEEDDELWGGAVSYKYRVEDPRLGRFFSVDPLAADYPWNSVYAFSENKVIHMIELEGLEAITFQDG